MALSAEEQKRAEALREREPPRGAMLLLAAIMAMAVAWVFYTRPAREVAVQSVPAGIAVGTVLLLIAAGILVSDRPKITFAGVVTAVLLLAALAAGAALAGVILYAAGSGLYDFYEWTHSDLTGVREKSLLWAAIVLAAPLAAAIGLFGIRVQYRALYGLSEATVGLWIASLRLSEAGSAHPRDLVLTILTASVYLMVRGFGNPGDCDRLQAVSQSRMILPELPDCISSNAS